MKLQTDLRAFVECLNAAKAEFLIVGGYAVGYHAEPRFTGDIDFFVGTSPENAARVADAICRFGFGSLNLTPADFQKPDMVVQLGRPPNRIDILTGVEAVTWEEAWQNRVNDTLDGLPVHFLSRELLIKNKAAAGRPKDLGDVENLRSHKTSPKRT